MCNLRPRRRAWQTSARFRALLPTLLIPKSPTSASPVEDEASIHHSNPRCKTQHVLLTTLIDLFLLQVPDSKAHCRLRPRVGFGERDNLKRQAHSTTHPPQFIQPPYYCAATTIPRSTCIPLKGCWQLHPSPSLFSLYRSLGINWRHSTITTSRPA